MKPLSVEELLAACREVMANAGQLLDEATLLFEHGHYARAYLLAHIACEEMAKSPMLYRAACELAFDKEPDWRKLDRRLRDHKEKIRNVLTMDYFQSDIRADDSDYTDYLDDLERVPQYNDAKNTSLYVGFDDGNLQSPSALFDRDHADALLRLAKARHEAFKAPLVDTREQLLERLEKMGEFARVLYTEGVDGLFKVARKPE